jgi:hypothetical protein
MISWTIKRVIIWTVCLQTKKLISITNPVLSLLAQNTIILLHFLNCTFRPPDSLETCQIHFKKLFWFIHFSIMWKISSISPDDWVLFTVLRNSSHVATICLLCITNLLLSLHLPLHLKPIFFHILKTEDWGLVNPVFSVIFLYLCCRYFTYHKIHTI